ncbi:hypothetical protein AYI92_05000 [Shewanella xiamenensis]|jgi:hypothetical protein|nr:hypothetical protein AYI90_05660 [Shewanella xiamenensis]TVL22151.1 hypothetical protein AYI91_06200 [Shewanella xiamenensis]TVL27898.1 hypothetical protein AYI92_05000 [Shewanella xiamenensis]TVL35791.1 hypothetical protein AYI93_05610 [Shewanella xiamenensis]TVP04029.1 hypothetical protein AYI89_05600 [Shewanella xiamenensis]
MNTYESNVQLFSQYLAIAILVKIQPANHKNTSATQQKSQQFALCVIGKEIRLAQYLTLFVNKYFK